MDCDISGEQLWSMIDRDAPELEEHLAICPTCRREAARLREKIGILTEDPNYEIPIPEKLGSYKVLRVLGEGGQAIVYEAEQLSPNRRVAVKVLKGGHLVGKTRLRHFQRETQTLARLNHPYIATIYEAGRTETGLYFFAMELIDGEPLHEYVKNQKPSRKELLDLMGKVCRAIEYAHGRGVIHRDLKPSNIMVDARGEPKILDFGLARLTRGDAGIDMTTTRDGRVEGTPRYMSPEQAIGLQSTIDARSDVYALGVLLYEVLTGAPPSRVTTISPDTIRTICEELPRRPSDIERSLGGEIDAILLKALEKKPEDRYQTVVDLEQDISRYLRGDPISAKSPSKLYYIKRQIVRRRALGWIGVAAVCGLAAAFWFSQRAPFDERSARFVALDIRFTLLRDGPGDLVYHRAREAIRKYPGLLDIELAWVQVRSQMREQNNAIGRLVRGLEEDPTLWSFRLLLNDIRVRDALRGDDEAENTYWSETLAASAEAWYIRSFATLDSQNALEWAREAVARDPENELYLTNLTYMNEISGDVEAALESARELTARGYRGAYWMVYRAMLFCRLGRYDDALDESNKIVKTNPRSHGAYGLRAKVQRRLKNYEAAVSDFSIAIDKYGKDNPAAAWHYYHRGTVRWLAGDREGAITDYETAHERLTFATYVNARLFIFLHETGRHKDAEAALAHARRSAKADPWIQDILACLGGDLSTDELVRIAETSGKPVRVCEAYYYAGETSLLNETVEDSREWFEKCLGTGVKYESGNYLDTISETELAEWRLAQFSSER